MSAPLETAQKVTHHPYPKPAALFTVSVSTLKEPIDASENNNDGMARWRCDFCQAQGPGPASRL